MSYILMKKIDPGGWSNAYRIECSNEDINVIKEELAKRVKDGCPVNKLRIVKDIPYEFKCGIKLDGEVDG